MLIGEFGADSALYLDYIQAVIQVNFEAQSLTDSEYLALADE